MTNSEIEDIYKQALANGRISALRAVWNAGWYQGASVTPTATSADRSLTIPKPVAVITNAKK